MFIFVRNNFIIVPNVNDKKRGCLSIRKSVFKTSDILNLKKKTNICLPSKTIK